MALSVADKLQVGVSMTTRGREAGPIVAEPHLEGPPAFDAPDRFDLFITWIIDSMHSIWERLTWVGLLSSVAVVVLGIELGGWSSRASGVLLASFTAGIAVAVAWQAHG